MSNIKKLNAPFRWAGSKAKITTTLFEKFKSADVYIEPFLGSGVVLFRQLQLDNYSSYIVNDINVSITSFYKALQEDRYKVLSQLKDIMNYFNSLETLEEKSDFYYQSRVDFNKDKSNYVLFWLLMKSGFNGLYRENKKGSYNAPFGKKMKIKLNEEELLTIGYLLETKNVQIYNLDYNDLYAKIENKDIDCFAYNDPPYCQSQDYTAEKFDNQLLADNLIKYDFPLAISDVDSTVSNKVYERYKKTIIQEVKRVIQVKNIKIVREVIYTNYQPNYIEQLSLF